MPAPNAVAVSSRATCRMTSLNPDCTVKDASPTSSTSAPTTNPEAATHGCTRQRAARACRRSSTDDRMITAPPIPPFDTPPPASPTNDDAIGRSTCPGAVQAPS
jgi:hypothetical protein